LNLQSRFGLFVSALKIPFPGNGDFGSKRRSSNVRLLSRKAEHLVLAGPFHWQVGEPRNHHAGREAGNRQASWKQGEGHRTTLHIIN
jgi:hypothetical protein